MGYFDDVQQKTRTRFWINNPTMDELHLALANGAVACTTNPSYVSKLLGDPVEKEFVLSEIKKLVLVKSDPDEIASELQRRMVMRLAKELEPLFISSNGTKGFVTIQSNPEKEMDADFLVSDGMMNHAIAPNVIIKVPVTKAGLAALSKLIRNNCPVMATEVMTLSQAMSVWKAYERNRFETGLAPLLFVTHITGIQDEFFKNSVVENNLKINSKSLPYAGLSIAKLLYGTWKENQFPGRMIGGGARKLEDFTELVGADMDVTINWKGTADVLLKKAPSVVDRSGFNISAYEIAELKDGLPGYKEAYEPEGLPVEDYFEYGGVELFRQSFLKGWHMLLNAIIEQKGDAHLIRKKTLGNIKEKRVLIRPGLERVTLTYNEKLQMCYFFIAKGAELEPHSHLPIQNGIILKGRVKFSKADEEFVLSEGDSYLFESKVPHGLLALEDTELLECFSPAREEYMIKED